MATKTRASIRTAFATMLSSALTGTGNPVSAVYDYFKGNLAGESPVILVTSGAITREIAGMGTTKYNSHVQLNLLVMVAEARTASGITEKNVDDLVDCIEGEIADVVSANQNNGDVWSDLMYTGQPSEPIPARDLDGNAYVMEIVKLEAMVND